jgi:hypothetical protein
MIVVSIYNDSMVCNEFYILANKVLFLLIIEDQIYASSNMDDLIDSIARRHLAYRRLNVCIKNFEYFSIEIILL